MVQGLTVAHITILQLWEPRNQRRRSITNSFARLTQISPASYSCPFSAPGSSPGSYIALLVLSLEFLAVCDSVTFFHDTFLNSFEDYWWIILQSILQFGVYLMISHDQIEGYAFWGGKPRKDDRATGVSAQQWRCLVQGARRGRPVTTAQSLSSSVGDRCLVGRYSETGQISCFLFSFTNFSIH